MEYYEAVGADFFIGLALALALIFVILVMAQKVAPTKSWRYRKYLTNLYIAGKVRQIAGKDIVDLTAEEKNFLEFDALSKSDRIKELDDKIELELIEKLDKESKGEFH